jgi:regulatory protein
VTGRGRREPTNPKSCHERALGLLAVRPRTRRELERRLLGAGFEPTEVDDVLGRLENAGLVDDRAFAEQFAEHQFGKRLAGRRAVTSGLLAKGVSPAIAAGAAADGLAEEAARAEQLARARAPRMSGLDPAKAFGRLTSLLLRRGYPPDVARIAARRALHLDASDDGALLSPVSRGRSIGSTRGRPIEKFNEDDP